MSQWIECVGAMPIQGQKVLVFTGKEVVAGEYWVHEPGFIDANTDDLFPVTHWMPLPEPPK